MPACSLCTVCRGIDYSRPCHGPEYRPCGGEFSAHLFYDTYSSLEDLRDSARDSSCELCTLILGTIEDSPAELFVEEEWDYIERLSPEAESDLTEAVKIDDVREKYARYFSNSLAARVDPLDVSAPIVVEIVFREPLRDEISSRCTDICVHWTETSPASGEAVRRKASLISLVSGLPGEGHLRK